ncbi:hypothetical protein CDD83_10797 [Cordyceps sp. RAO-2017]|nr:hypothetical protein CDD83_10797 [Cordyceps sp. RAO-2017]
MRAARERICAVLAAIRLLAERTRAKTACCSADLAALKAFSRSVVDGLPGEGLDLGHARPVPDLFQQPLGLVQGLLDPNGALLDLLLLPCERGADDVGPRAVVDVAPADLGVVRVALDLDAERTARLLGRLGRLDQLGRDQHLRLAREGLEAGQAQRRGRVAVRDDVGEVLCDGPWAVPVVARNPHLEQLVEGLTVCRDDAVTAQRIRQYP